MSRISELMSERRVSYLEAERIAKQEEQGSLAASNGSATCVWCERKLSPSPTKLWWFKHTGAGRGLCYECALSTAGNVLRALQHATEDFKTSDGTGNVSHQSQGGGSPIKDAALPCPFCGGIAKIFAREIHDTTPEPRRKLYWYVCSTYGCGVGVQHGEWSEQVALEKWNRRIQLPND